MESPQQLTLQEFILHMTLPMPICFNIPLNLENAPFAFRSSTEKQKGFFSVSSLARHSFSDGGSVSVVNFRIKVN